MSKADKQLKQYKQIGESVAMITETRETLEQLAERYDEWIDEAAELGEDSYSDQLIEEQIDLEDFARDLKFLEKKVIQNAISAKTFNELKKLPAAMATCKKLLSGAPDMKRLVKQMSEFGRALDKSRSSLKDLRAELSTSKDPLYADLFGDRKSYDPKRESRIEAKKKEREARFAVKVSKNVPTPMAPSVAAASTDATADAIAQMMAEENRKD